jgi:hypothetical protein
LETKYLHYHDFEIHGLYYHILKPSTTKMNIWESLLMWPANYCSVPSIKTFILQKSSEAHPVFSSVVPELSPHAWRKVLSLTQSSVQWYRDCLPTREGKLWVSPSLQFSGTGTVSPRVKESSEAPPVFSSVVPELSPHAWRKVLSLTQSSVQWYRDCLSTREEKLWAPPSLQVRWYRGSLPTDKGASHESDQSPPSSTDVKDGSSCISILACSFKVSAVIFRSVRLVQCFLLPTLFTLRLIRRSSVCANIFFDDTKTFWYSGCRKQRIWCQTTIDINFSTDYWRES